MSQPWTAAHDPLVSFVIPVRNDADNLARCLKAIQDQPGAGPLEIIVADNGSTDASREVAAAFGATVLHLPELPPSALRNAGTRLARGSLIAFIDADNQMVGGWLAAALPHFANPEVGAVGHDYSPPPGGSWVQQVYDAFRHHPVTPQPVRWLATGNIIVRRDATLAIDGFDESLETSEDFDFCNRLRLSGYAVLSDPRLASIHFGDPRTLAELYRGELWRGRDTLRVGLRGIHSWMDLPSMVFPIIALASMAVAVVTLMLAWPVDPGLLRWTAGAGLVIAALSLLRTVRMLTRVRARGPLTVARFWTVALVYDLARAFALVVRTPHRRRAAPSPKRRQAAA